MNSNDPQRLFFVWGTLAEGLEPRCAQALLGSNILQTAVPLYSGKRAYVLTESGEVKQWGPNEGWGNVQSQDRAIAHSSSSSLIGQPITAIACGDRHYAAVAADGTLYTWGNGSYGQLGHGCKDDEEKPRKVEAFAQSPVKQVACGESFTTALTTSGKVYTWGNNRYGRTGYGLTDGDQLTPKLVEGSLQDKIITQVACGQSFVGAVSEDGDLFTWGRNYDGQLGLGRTDDCNPSPQLVEKLRGRTKMVSCGERHCIAVTEDGRLHTFGENDCGQLGHNDTKNRSTPTLVDFGQLEIDKVVGGDDSSFAVTKSGQLYSWGRGSDGALGHGTREREKAPRLVKRLKTCCTTHVEASGKSIFAIVSVPPGSDFVPIPVVLGGALNDVEFGYVSFQLEDGEPIHAHRVILAQRCKFFANMFRSGMKEAKFDAPIPIPNVRRPIFLILLEYLYRGTLTLSSSKDALEVSALAHMYSLEKLEERCAESVCLAMDNVVDMLQSATDRKLDVLKDRCMAFAVQNYRKLVRTEDFGKLDKETVLAVFRAAVEKM